MTWTQPARSAAAAQIDASAAAEQDIRPERYRFDPDTIVDRATRGGRVDPAAFADGWRTGLARYLASADRDGHLNALGRRMVADTATARLTAGARVHDRLAAEPALAGAALAPPIVIVGGWRTGTTYLFRLLAGDPRLHAPPCPPSSARHGGSPVSASPNAASCSTVRPAHTSCCTSSTR